MSEKEAKYPPQEYTQKLLDKNIISFLYNDLIDDEENIEDYITYMINNNYALIYEGQNIFSITEIYKDEKFVCFEVEFNNAFIDIDPQQIDNVNDILIYKHMEEK